MEVQAPKRSENQRREEEEIDVSNTVLPQDIMLDVLLRLPVKSLVPFRFVSKSWYKLIRSTSFTNMHFKRLNKQNSCRGQLIIRDFEDDIFKLDFQEPDQSVDVKKFRVSGREGGMRCQNIWGSSKGLICIQLFRGVNKISSSLYLWNPCTMEHREIPPLKNHPLGSNIVYGFGYNYILDDYEILGITCIEDEFSFRSAVSVYSVREKLWREHLDIPYNIHCKSNSGVQCNGAFHWVALTSDTRKYDGKCYYPLIAYDTRGKTYRDIPLPKFIEGCDITLRVLRDKLWIRHDADFWVMNEYGVRDSWTKLLSFPDTADPIRLRYPFCSTDCGFIYGVNDNLVLYDPEKKNTLFDIKSISGLYSIIYCMESTVGVDFTI